MKPQTTVLINRETTKQEVDKWMEDLFVRIQLRIMHPHSIIRQDGTPENADAKQRRVKEVMLLSGDPATRL
jgi:hypothetical protein